MSTDDTQPVRCMFLPLSDRGLLVPSTGVAEIVGMSPPRPIDAAPPWLLGYMSWRGVDIPLLSVESALGDEAPPVGVRNRVAVMYALRDDLQPGFYGVVIQRLPTVVLASERNLETGDADASQWIDGAVDLEVGRGLVPGFAYLEGQLAGLAA
ncbi:MAG: chemotaxis protein CheW [Pseudomonadota bacterium]